jgi:hypothetical protein
VVAFIAQLINSSLLTSQKGLKKQLRQTVRKKWRKTNFKYSITSPVKFGIRAMDKGQMEMSGHKENHTGLLELDKFDTHIRKQKRLSFEYWICGRCKTRIKLHLRNAHKKKVEEATRQKSFANELTFRR